MLSERGGSFGRFLSAPFVSFKRLLLFKGFYICWKESTDLLKSLSRLFVVLGQNFWIGLQLPDEDLE